MEIKTAEPIDAALARLAKLLVDTATAHEDADRELRDAQSQQMTALNDMNKAQRDFDAFVEKLHANAPSKSDWKGATFRSGRLP